MNQSKLLGPSVVASQNGGLLLMGSNGQHIHIPDSEVEATIAEMETVRAHQLRRECTEIADSVRYLEAV